MARDPEREVEPFGVGERRSHCTAADAVHGLHQLAVLAVDERQDFRPRQAPRRKRKPILALEHELLRWSTEQTAAYRADIERVMDGDFSDVVPFRRRTPKRQLE